MGITPGMWALILCVVLLSVLHVGVYITVSKLKQRIKKLEENKK